MVSPQKIKFNGVFSNDGLGALDIILDVTFDSDNGAVSSYLNRSAVASESYDGRYKNTYGYKYDELFSPQFTIVKKDFSNFTQEEVRKVLKYLTSTDKPSLLEVYYDGASNIVDWACIGGWTSIETYKIANSRTVGIVARFEAITPYAFSDLHTVTQTVSSPTNNKITIEIETDDNKPIYPRVIINHGYNPDDSSTTPIPHTVVDITGTKPFTNVLDMIDYVEDTVYKNNSTYYWKTSEPTYMYSSKAPTYEDWKIVETTRAYTANDTFESNTFYKYNNTYYWMDPYAFHSNSQPPSLAKTSVKFTNKHTDFFNKQITLPPVIIKNNSSTEVITLDGANKIIGSSSPKRIFNDDFENWQWLELHDGKNEITVLGDCKVTLQWREVRKVGEW